LRHLLLVSHRPLAGAGGAVSRWRSLSRLLPAEGWEVDVVAGSDALPAEFDPSQAVDFRRRARTMGRLRAVSGPPLAAVGLRPAAVTTSTFWALRGARLVRTRLAEGAYDVVLATAPPIAALAAAALGLCGRTTPLVVELRDLWAGSPAYETRPGALSHVESALLRKAAALVVVTPEALEDVRHRHPWLRTALVPNGFEPELLDRRVQRAPGRPITLLHSGTLIPQRPLTPLLDALRRRPSGSFRLVLHGYLSAESAAEIAARGSGLDIEVVQPSPWVDAIDRMISADVCVVTQARDAGDATAVAGKVYEYLALGKPILCLSDGGATWALLERLGAAGLAANLDSPAEIDAALDRLESNELPPPVEPAILEPYSRVEQARQLAAVLDAVAASSLVT
jgi:glycosyltransferase involved in cell wall biosynthesis